MKAHINLDDGSNLTEISPILTCIQTLNESGALWHEGFKNFRSLSLKQLKSENHVSKQNGFCFAVSLRDGACLYTSDAITDHLGYPNDMLAGQCIMNFLFQKDHITFANHLTQGLNACFIQGKKDNSHLVLNTFFCRLRVYHSLRYGFSISDKKTQYKPFKITLHIKELIVDDLCVETSPSTLAVKAIASHISSAYSIPEEIPAMTSFSTRHTASCHFSHVDASAIPYFGYLPQDMVGYSVFDFYHVDDLPQLKDIYELVVQEQGGSFRSKPYRFKVQNGCYIMLETEWSCFVNPWSHKLEFVVGQHRVLKGPSDIDIFAPCEIEDVIPEEILKESLVIQKEIKTLLSQSIQSFQQQQSKRFCNKRKRDLAAFVYNCIDETLNSKSKGKAEKHCDMFDDDGSNSDPDSVVMGDISPYRETKDSSVSCETPPTMQQIRYQENIERFFASDPQTHLDGWEYPKSEKLPSVGNSQGSSSGSGKTSGKTSTSKGIESSLTASVNFENNNQNLSGSNSSKCNLSSFTTGDSGFCKSMEKEANDPSVSQAGSSSQLWPKDSPSSFAHLEKFSPCLALTEESLSVHNRINHKHLKQQQRKSKSNIATAPLKDTTWFHQKESVTLKNKKTVHTQTLTPPPPEDSIKGSHHVKPSNLDFCSPTEKKGSVPDNAIPGSSITNPFYFSPNQCAPTPTPFYIPVMYLGSMPYYPSGPSNQPQWPFAPVASQTASSATDSKPVPMTSNFQIPVYPNNFKLSESTSTEKCGISTAVTTTTTSVTTQAASMYKNVAEGFSTINAHLETDNRNREIKSNFADCDMQMEESDSSSFTRSSSYQSGDKSDDMEFDIKETLVRARSGKVELSSDIAYRYQMDVLSLEDVLQKDRARLQSMQQPEMVNQQLLMLHDEREAENEVKVNANDFCMSEDVMLGLSTDDEVNEELEYREECLLQFMCEEA